MSGTQSDTVSPVNGATSYNFSKTLVNGNSYTVSIGAQPTGQTCSLTNATGTVGTTNVSNVNLSCKAASNSSSSVASSSVSSITAYLVTALAGSGVEGYADGTGISALFVTPLGVAVYSAGNVYVADQGNNRIRKISLVQ